MDISASGGSVRIAHCKPLVKSLFCIRVTLEDCTAVIKDVHDGRIMFHSIVAHLAVIPHLDIHLKKMPRIRTFLGIHCLLLLRSPPLINGCEDLLYVPEDVL